MSSILIAGYGGYEGGGGFDVSGFGGTGETPQADKKVIIILGNCSLLLFPHSPLLSIRSL
jgi:hypothetical protein